MNFLAKHFEKIILAVCLLCLIWSIKSVSDNGTAEVELTAQASRDMSDPYIVSKGQKMVETLDESTLVEFKDMQNPPGLALNLQTNGDSNPRASGLFDGGKYVICKCKTCGYAIPFDTDVCPNPECKDPKQDAVAEEPPPSHDLDHDGIPDLYEKNYVPALDYRYPYDSMEDFDLDGFLNIEEYRAGTEITDAKSRPALAFLLRRDGKALRSDIPIILRRVKTFDDPNPSAWKANLSINKSNRPVDVRVGDKIPDTSYTLASISPNDETIVIHDAAGTEYTLRKNQSTPEKGFSIDFIYLDTHYQIRPVERDSEQMSKPAMTEEDYEKIVEQRERGNRTGGTMAGAGPMQGQGPGGGVGAESYGMNGNYPNDHRPSLRFRLQVGDTFVLQKIFTLPNRDDAFENPEAEGLVTEYYRVLEVEIVEPEEDGEETEEGKAKESKDIVLVQQLSDENGVPVGDPIEVPMLDKLPTVPRILPVQRGEEPEPAPASNDYFINLGNNQMGVRN